MNEEVIDQTIEEASTVDDSATESVEQPALETPEIDPHEEKIQKRIDKAIYEKHQAKREAESLKARLAEFESRQSQGETNEAPTEEQIYSLIQQEAQRMRAEETYTEACNRTYDAGVAEFGKGFDNAMRNIQLVGLSQNRDFLEMVSSSDTGAKIIEHLGTDIDHAEKLMSMTPLQMARELGRLEIKLANAPQKVKAVSKAPAPITPVSGRSGGGKKPSDGTMSNEEYLAWRKQK